MGRAKWSMSVIGSFENGLWCLDSFLMNVYAVLVAEGFTSVIDTLDNLTMSSAALMTSGNTLSMSLVTISSQLATLRMSCDAGGFPVGTCDPIPMDPLTSGADFTQVGEALCPSINYITYSSAVVVGVVLTHSRQKFSQT